MEPLAASNSTGSCSTISHPSSLLLLLLSLLSSLASLLLLSPVRPAKTSLVQRVGGVMSDVVQVLHGWSAHDVHHRRCRRLVRLGRRSSGLLSRLLSGFLAGLFAGLFGRFLLPSLKTTKREMWSRYIIFIQ